MIPGYKITTEIFRGRKRIVYRGQQEEDKKPVIIKTLLDDFPTAADLAALRREYEILKSLQIEGIAKAYALEKYQKSLALILEDKGGETLRNLIDFRKQNQGPPSTESFTTAKDFILFLEIAIQLSTILAELHQNHIIHKDINPKNILINLETHQVELIDFSISSRLPREDQKISHPNLLEGTLAYISPEQTGRMNRALDYRTDFYSLGITLYEMLTGQLPFDSTDPLELVHAHIARTPRPPIELNSKIPRMISDIIMKLLSKTAENRYDSAFGLKVDLELCLNQLQSKGQIDVFVPGQHEVSDRFNIPQKLYGREGEIQILMATFDRVCQGKVELMLVSGYSGIGKTSLINEIHKPIVCQKGYFIHGKFDQLNRIVPYSAIIQAFQELIRQLLTESAEEIQLWKEKLLEALGSNGQIIIEVIPEVELIIGQRPAVPELGPTESQNRFNRVFQKFISVFAKSEHPLVIFLDDLQWADSASLKLIQTLTTNPNIRYLLVLGAYRDNEVSASHPLILTLAEIQKSGAEVSHISLTPLSVFHLTELIADTLKCEKSRSRLLADLVMRKTHGNPFFVTQFLRSLYQENLLEFDYHKGQWQFDINRIESREMTDNVVELMTSKIQKLSDQTQQTLKLAACIGNQFDLNTLSIVNEKPFNKTANELWEAIQEGLILPVGDTADGWLWAVDHKQEREGDEILITRPQPSITHYKFLHDRVQQAAYDLIPEDRKKEVHLRVGRLMLVKSHGTEREERLFDIVNHLNLSRELLTDQKDRDELAGLNLTAGRKARASTAYKTALSYFCIGRDLLNQGGWTSNYDFTFTLYTELAECEFLCGLFEEAEYHFSFLLEKAQTRLDKARIYDLKIYQYENLTRYAEAIRVGHEALSLFGVSFPYLPEEKQAALDAELSAIQTLIGNRTIDSLIDLPIMEDPENRMVMKLLSNLHTSCYLVGDKLLTLLNTSKMVRLSLIYGNTPESAHAYVLHAMHIGPIRGDYKSAYEFGLLAMHLNERFPHPGLRAKILMNFSWAVSIWRRPIADSFTYTQEAFRLANESGFFSDGAFALFNETYFTLLTNRELGALQAVCEANVTYLKRIQMDGFVDAPQVIQHWGLALQGFTESSISLTTTGFSEATYQQVHKGHSLFEMFYLIAKLTLLYTFEEYAEACKVAEEAEQIIGDYTGTIWDELRVFYYALVLTALYPGTTAEKRRKTDTILSDLNKRLAWWAENSPYNFRSQHLIVSAEIARVQGRDPEAVTLYEAAIETTTDQECPRERALANELYAKFWQNRGQERIAAVFMTEAQYHYTQWGAAAKVKDLQGKYPDLLSRQVLETLTSSPLIQATTYTKASILDVATVLKAAQAISGEIVLEKLLEKLMKIVIENAGAQKGLLIQEKEGKNFIQAQGWTDKLEVKIPHPVPTQSSQALLLDSRQNFSSAIVNYVKRTRESLVIADAGNDGRFANDRYVSQNKPRSILCVPILRQSQLIGILYLENNLIAAAFTPERIEVVQILSSQAAISLENARLYEEMKQEIVQRQRAEKELQRRADEFMALYETTRDLAGHHDLLDLLQIILDRATSLLHASSGSIYLYNPVSNDLELVVVKGIPVLPGIRLQLGEGLVGRVGQTRQPLSIEDYQTWPHRLLKFEKIPVTAVIAVPMLYAGKLIGILSIDEIDPTTRKFTEADVRLLSLFAAHAASTVQNARMFETIQQELRERKRAEEALREALSEVEQLKNRLQAENIYLQEEIKTEHNFEEIVGTSKAIRKVFQSIEKVAGTDTTVLITGETGTGKELVARAIHNLSNRKESPLIKVNCAALPTGLIESELFGHEKGAFTGAITKKKGRFELADSGTIFLDEVGELPLETQAKLLRVLQEQEFERVGGIQTLEVNVRVIAATNRTLEEVVKMGAFRVDLFYRLNIFPIHLPALRERREDIPLLINYFVGKFSRRMARKIDRVSHEALKKLMDYHWPGNVRELANVLERAVILCDGGMLQPDHMGISDLASTSNTEVLTLEEAERRHILKALEKTKWIVGGPSGAAKLLGLNRTTLLARMKKLGIEKTNI
jgi:Nif-specific regulatory protein